MEEIIRDWIIKINGAMIPSPIKALHFGLYESGNSYTLYLVGSIQYAVGNEDWIFDADYRPNPKFCNFDSTSSSGNWENVLSNVKSIIENKLLDTNVFKNVQYITYGFDSGDLYILRNKS